jgi:hypothetical protein
MCSLGYCHAFLLSTDGVDGLELFLYSLLSGVQEHMLLHNSYLYINIQNNLRIFIKKGDINKSNLLFFNIVSLYFNTYGYINLTIDGAIYPSQHFPFGEGFLSQAGHFWTPPPIVHGLNITS